MDKNITIGVAYYPEHWPQEEWLSDIQKIKASGMTTVRIAELAWYQMEPEEGKYDLEWLADFVRLAGENGLKVILGTPSEATPVWMRDRYPEIISMNTFKQRTGKRGFHCHNSPVFRRLISQMTVKMAERFGKDPTVVGWQIDNEMRGVECHCDYCQEGFRKWLKERYGSLQGLNDAWGTKFWSQVYNTWEEVRLPSNDQVTISTSQVVDYKRFISYSTVSFQNMQVDILRVMTKNQFISHNALNALYYAINMYDLAEKLDFYAWDVYPHVDDLYTRYALGHDLARGTKHDNFWILEQKNGYFNGSTYNLALEPGVARAWAYQDIARGANGVMFYRWRANRWGQEQNPNAIVRHDGTFRRAYGEITQLCGELAPISESLAATKVRADVAILQNYADIWAHEAKQQYTNISHEKVTLEYYQTLLRKGVTVDLVQPGDAQLSKYKLVIAPNLMLISHQDAENLTRYVEGGGRLMVSVRTGMKNENNVVVNTPWPGELRGLCGVTVDEFEAFPEHAWTHVDYRGKNYQVRMWADILTAQTAQTEGVYSEKFYKGQPAITRNAHGTGFTIYMGVAGCPELIADLLEEELAACGIATTALQDGVYMTVRESEEKRYLFLINMRRETVMVKAPYKGQDCLTGAEYDGRFEVAPLGVMLIDCIK